jgi:uncharacterized protein (DUF924 family)
MNNNVYRTEILLKMLKDNKINKEMKLFIILNLLHGEDISLQDAYTLCTEYEIFSRHWIEINTEYIPIFEKYYYS